MDYHPAIEILIQPATLLAITPAVSTVFIFTLVLLFFVSFLLSGAQVAYFSLTVKDINNLKTRSQPSYRRIVDLLESPKSLYTSIVIANTIVNIAIILIGNMLLDEWVLQYNLPLVMDILIKVVIITIAIVLFAEILPRIWASHHKIWFASTSSMVVEYSTLLFGKISKRVVYISSKIESLFAGKPKTDDRDAQVGMSLLDEEDTSKEEKKILSGILQFGNTTVKQAMRTRLDIVGIEITQTFDQVLQKIKDGIYSRMPVYNGNLDEIMGILHTKDILPHLKEPADFDWQSLLRPAYYVHEHKLIEELLQDFRSKRIHLAVVVDEFGGTAGIITLEDVIEEIVGEIHDEFDVEENKNFQIDDHTFIFEGKTMIDEACKIMKIPLATFDKIRGDSDSVAGLVLEIAGDFPEENVELTFEGFSFNPLQINKNRILKIHVKTPGSVQDET